MWAGRGAAQGMVKYASLIPRESIVDVEGRVARSPSPVEACTQTEATPLFTPPPSTYLLAFASHQRLPMQLSRIVWGEDCADNTDSPKSRAAAARWPPDETFVAVAASGCMAAPLACVSMRACCWQLRPSLPWRTGTRRNQTPLHSHALRDSLLRGRHRRTLLQGRCDRDLSVQGFNDVSVFYLLRWCSGQSVSPVPLFKILLEQQLSS